MGLSDMDIVREIGQTPCICGDLDTWHPVCYRGKTAEEVRRLARGAMRAARREVARRRSASAEAIIRAAAGAVPARVTR